MSRRTSTSPLAALRRALDAQVPQKALRDLTNRLTYGPDAPLSDECIWVDPLAVNHFYTGQKARPLRRGNSGQVIPGDWDLDRAPWTETEKAQSCRLHFVQGVPWSETPIYARLLREIAAGKRPDGLNSQADLDARYARLDTLWHDARRNGLSPRSETPAGYRREHGGILVHVGRDGTLIRSGGAMHRFAIARLLELPKVPAQLGAVHPEALAAGHLRTLRQPPSTRAT
ncbi:hypothetical protein [Roseivivax sp. CAU 1753]